MPVHGVAADSEPRLFLMFPSGGQRCRDLLRAFSKMGLQAAQASTPNALRSLMRRRRADVILVYSPPGSDLAQRVLFALGDLPQSRVVVLTEDSDFSHYYDLMGQGAFAYYALTEDYDRIAAAMAALVRRGAGRPAAAGPVRLAGRAGAG